MWPIISDIIWWIGLFSIIVSAFVLFVLAFYAATVNGGKDEKDSTYWHHGLVGPEFKRGPDYSMASNSENDPALKLSKLASVCRGREDPICTSEPELARGPGIAQWDPHLGTIRADGYFCPIPNPIEVRSDNLPWLDGSGDAKRLLDCKFDAIRERYAYEVFGTDSKPRQAGDSGLNFPSNSTLDLLGTALAEHNKTCGCLRVVRSDSGGDEG